MPIMIFGSRDEETGAEVTTRSVESNITVPKIESELKDSNLGFQPEVSYEGVGFWDRIKYAAERAFTTQPGPEGWREIGAEAPELEGARQKAEDIAGDIGLSSAFNSILIITVLVAAITVIPRILPIRS